MNCQREPQLGDLVAVLRNPGQENVQIGDVGTVLKVLSPSVIEIRFLKPSGHTSSLPAADLLVLNDANSRPSVEEAVKSPMLSLLAEMRGSRIGMWIGRKSLSDLAIFLGGFEVALLRMGVEDPFRLLQFGEWLHRHYRTNSALGWWTLILEHSDDEADAVDHFWKLLDQFLAASPEVGRELSCRAADQSLRAKENSGATR